MAVTRGDRIVDLHHCSRRRFSVMELLGVNNDTGNEPNKHIAKTGSRYYGIVSIMSRNAQIQHLIRQTKT